MVTLNLCECSTNIIQNTVVQCKSCGNTFCDDNCKNNILKQTEKIIQNQVRVSESQLLDVKGALTIGADYLKKPVNLSDSYPFKNMSDRREAHGMRNAHGMLYTNVPTRGNSVRSSVTSCKPGSTAPGGKGVDVKHGSYARYLGKLKSRTIVSDEDQSFPLNINGSRTRPAMNNKSYRFSITNTSCYSCNKHPLVN